MFNVNRKQFEKIVWSALDALPPALHDKIQNLEISIEDYARPEHYENGIVPDDEDMFGLYIGTPLTHRAFGYDLNLPDQIIIFKNPHEDICNNLSELIAEVTITVRHEIAHYFGISDERLEDLDAY
jgi:predicted Zn-dependent protease with MMP-like domain